MTNRRVSVTVDADVSPFVRGLTTASAAARAYASELDSADSRMANLVQTGLALAPALVPIGAQAVPVVAGLAAQLGFAATAAGVSVLAFQGVGDALKALNEYQLDPTVQNWQAMQEAMAKMPAEGQEFVRFLQTVRPQFEAWQAAAQQGLFPGAQEGIEEVLKLSPLVIDLIETVSTTTGDLLAEAGDNLNDPRWRDFFRFLDKEAGPTLSAMGRSLGNVVEGLANMMMAFDPLADDFTRGMADAARDFRDWSADLDESQGFQSLVGYIRDTGPQALETLGALGGALLSLVEAAAPVGQALLPVIETLADGLSAIAESPAGPVLVTTAAAIGTLGRSLALLQTVGLRGGDSFVGRALGLDTIKAAPSAYRQVAAAQAELQGAQAALAAQAVRTRDAQFALIPTTEKRAAVADYAAAQRKVASASEAVAVAERERTAAMRASLGQTARVAGLVGGLALATSGYADKMGLANTTTLALMGTIGGPWGAAIGGAIGLMMDFAAANNDAETAVDAATRAIESGSRDQLRAVRTTLRQIKREQEDALDFDWSLNPIQHVTEGWSWANARLRDLTGTATDVPGALDRVNSAMDRTGGLADLLGDAVGRTARQLEVASGNAEALSGALSRLQGWLDRRGALRNWEESLDNLNQLLRDGATEWTDNNKAGRENLATLDASAEAIAQVASQMKNAEARRDFLAGARASLRDFARGAAPAARRAIEQVIDKLDAYGLTAPKKPKLDVDNRPAKRGFDEVDRWFAQWDGSRGEAVADVDNKPARRRISDAEDWVMAWGRENESATVDADTSAARSALTEINSYITTVTRPRTVHIGVSGPGAAVGGAGGGDGGGGSWWTGGYTGRGGKFDPAGVVHRREFVFSSEATDGNEAFLDALHRQLRGYASGGYVDDRPAPAWRPTAVAASIPISRRIETLRARQNPAAPVQVVAAAPSLAGVRIEGRLEVNDRGEHYLRGVIREEIDGDRRFERVRTGGGQRA